MIAKITRVYTRTYSDNKQVTTYVEWIGPDSKSGRTEGREDNPHMLALILRGGREGIQHTRERW